MTLHTANQSENLEETTLRMPLLDLNTLCPHRVDNTRCLSLSAPLAERLVIADRNVAARESQFKVGSKSKQRWN